MNVFYRYRGIYLVVALISEKVHHPSLSNRKGRYLARYGLKLKAAREVLIRSMIC